MPASPAAPPTSTMRSTAGETGGEQQERGTWDHHSARGTDVRDSHNWQSGMTEGQSTAEMTPDVNGASAPTMTSTTEPADPLQVADPWAQGARAPQEHQNTNSLVLALGCWAMGPLRLGRLELAPEYWVVGPLSLE